MVRALYYPKADRTSQDYSRRHPGEPLAHPDVLVIHTTEGVGWPTYSNGATAPTFTYWPGKGFRQHFPVNMASRALVNLSGGVETNNANAIQIELVGTCTQGGPGYYWPNATDPDLRELADFLRWLQVEWGLILSSTSKPWLPYPSSYGATKARMSFEEWREFKGICGHQHVPENDHGDPGAFPMMRLLQLAVPTKHKPAITGRLSVKTLFYARRGTPDYGAASWYVEATGGDCSATTNLAAARSAATAGIKVVAVGGPACDDLKGIAGVVAVNGSNAVDTGLKLASLGN